MKQLLNAASPSGSAEAWPVRGLLLSFASDAELTPKLSSALDLSR